MAPHIAIDMTDWAGRVLGVINDVQTALPDAETVLNRYERSSDSTERWAAAHCRAMLQRARWRHLMKLKIVSDGHAHTTRLIDAETGQDITADLCCEHIEINLRDPVTATLRCVGLPFEVTAQAVAERMNTLIYDPDDGDSIDQAIALLQERRAERMRQ